MLTKKMLFVKSKRSYQRDPSINIVKLLNISTEQARTGTQDKVGFAALVERVFDNENPSRQFENTGADLGGGCWGCAPPPPG